MATRAVLLWTVTALLLPLASCAALQGEAGPVEVPALPTPPPLALDETEQRRAGEIAERNANVAALLRPGPSYLTSVDLVRDKEAEERGAAARLALVTHYSYDGDLTVETLVDLTRGEVVEVRSASNQPTPLSTAEFERATELALDDPQVREQLPVPREQITVEPLLTRAASPDDPLFGHRIARLLFKVGRDYLSAPEVHVDLTDERVIVGPLPPPGPR